MIRLIVTKDYAPHDAMDADEGKVSVAIQVLEKLGQDENMLLRRNEWTALEHALEILKMIDGASR